MIYQGRTSDDLKQNHQTTSGADADEKSQSMKFRLKLYPVCFTNFSGGQGGYYLRTLIHQSAKNSCYLPVNSTRINVRSRVFGDFVALRTFCKSESVLTSVEIECLQYSCRWLALWSFRILSSWIDVYRLPHLNGAKMGITNVVLSQGCPIMDINRLIEELKTKYHCIEY